MAKIPSPVSDLYPGLGSPVEPMFVSSDPRERTKRRNLPVIPEGPGITGMTVDDLFRRTEASVPAEGPMLDDVYAGELRRGFAPPEGLDVVSGLEMERARLEEEARAQNAIRILRELLSR